MYETMIPTPLAQNCGWQILKTLCGSLWRKKSSNMPGVGCGTANFFAGWSWSKFRTELALFVLTLFKALGDLLVLIGNIQHCPLRLGIRDLVGHGSCFIGPRAPMLRIGSNRARHPGPPRQPASI